MPRASPIRAQVTRRARSRPTTCATPCHRPDDGLRGCGPSPRGAHRPAALLQVCTDGGGFSSMARCGHNETQPSQMWTPGPATSRSTSSADRPQNEHASVAVRRPDICQVLPDITPVGNPFANRFRGPRRRENQGQWSPRRGYTVARPLRSSRRGGRACAPAPRTGAGVSPGSVGADVARPERRKYDPAACSQHTCGEGHDRSPDFVLPSNESRST